jgi:hypothetical protein
MARITAAALLAGLVAGVSQPAAAAMPLATGVAVYEITIEDSSPVTGFVDIRGTMSSGLLRSCRSYRIETELAAELFSFDGDALPMNLKSVNVEEGDRLTFDVLGEMASISIDRAEGVATRTEEGVSVELAAPRAETLTFDGNILFPVALTNALIAAAKAGEKLAHFRVYDGSGFGREVLFMSVVIGDAQDGGGNLDDEALMAAGLGFGDIARWPMTFSYFPSETKKTMTPSGSAQGIVYENGFTLAAVYDFGELAMRLKLVEFRPVAPEPCP